MKRVTRLWIRIQSRDRIGSGIFKRHLGCGFRHVPATHSDLIPATDSDRVPATHSDPVPATYSDRVPATLLVEVAVSDQG